MKCGSGAARVALAALFTLTGCASDPPPKPRKVRKTPVVVEPAEPDPALEDKSAAVATEWGVDPAALAWSPSKKLFAAVVTDKVERTAEKAGEKTDETKAPEPAIVVYRKNGERHGTFAPPTPGPIAELSFLNEERLVYLVPPRPPPAPVGRGKRAGGRHRGGGKHKALAKAAGPARGKARGRAGKGGRALAAAPPLPTIVYAIQPLDPGAAPIVCTGRRFAFSTERDHVAWVVGEPGGEYVAADGVQVYPRQGTTAIQGAPAWSRDGGSLALVQTQPAPLLVVLVEVDNPNGDNTWPLPPEAIDPTLNVFWADAGTVVVGPALTKPVFAASFKREPNRPTAVP